VVPDRQAKSPGSITLKVALDDENNFREEHVTFEVVSDVYTCVCSCRQCWASKCRGL
jgi:hypothetical protein